MQVKKFEAPTIQEALDHVKRELGPEAIILQTKTYKKGFGLLSKPSIEITAAISDRSLQKKKTVVSRLGESKSEFQNFSATQQASTIEKYYSGNSLKQQKQKQKQDEEAEDVEDASKFIKTSSSNAYLKNLSERSEIQDPLQLSRSKVTATRYVDIPDPKNIQNTLQKTNVKDALQVSRSCVAQESGGLTEVSKAKTHFSSAMTKPTELTPHDHSPDHSRSNSLSRSETHPHTTLPTPIDEVVGQAVKQAIDSLQARDMQRFPLAYTPLKSPILEDAFEQLVLNGVDRRFAYMLIKKVSFELGEKKIKEAEAVFEGLATEIMESIQTTSLFVPQKNVGVLSQDAAPRQKSKNELFISPPCSPFHSSDSSSMSTPHVLALVGPTGVGKTTTLAKIASEASLKKGLKVGLLNLDHYKVGAFDQLATFGKLLHLPFRSAACVADFHICLNDFKNLDLVLVDTTGRSPRDYDVLQEMKDVLSSVEHLKTYLTLSVTTREAELYDMAKRFSVFKPSGLILSKLDEAIVYGSIYNVSHRSNIPLAYFTTGQKVPDDIEPATQERLISLIMDI